MGLQHKHPQFKEMSPANSNIFVKEQILPRELRCSLECSLCHFHYLFYHLSNAIMDLMDFCLTHKRRSCDNFVLFIYMYFVSTVKENKCLQH